MATLKWQHLFKMCLAYNVQKIFKVTSGLLCIWKLSNICCDIIGHVSLQAPLCVDCLLLLCRLRNSARFDGSQASLCLQSSLVWQQLSGSAQTRRGCPGDSQQPLSMTLLCPSLGVWNKSSHATGHTKNTVQMVATEQLAMYPGPVWFTGADTANLFHLIISKDISPVIRMLLFPCCPFAVFLWRGRRSTPITWVSLLLETFAISNPATGKSWVRAKDICRVTLAEFSALKETVLFLLKWVWLRFIQSSDTTEVKIRPREKVTFDKQPHSQWTQQEVPHKGQFLHSTNLLCCKKWTTWMPAAEMASRQVKAKVRLMQQCSGSVQK